MLAHELVVAATFVGVAASSILKVSNQSKGWELQSHVLWQTSASKSQILA
jgi:hypothetical protein